MRPGTPRTRIRRARPCRTARVLGVLAALGTSQLFHSAPIAAQSSDGSTYIATGVDVAATRYRSEIEWLAADERQGRGLGTDGLAAAGEWIELQFQDIGLEAAGENGGYRQTFSVPVPGPDGDPHGSSRWYAFNVVGRLRAGSPDRLPGLVVIGAHYDHLGYGEEGSLEPDLREIHNGADDNASGTVAVLEIARVLAARRTELRRDVIFLAFSSEERGLIGSRAFVRSPTGGIDLGEVTAMLNLDMVGNLTEDRLQVLGGDSAEEWKEIVGPLCSSHGLECSVGGDGYGSSDQSAFYEVDIPVLHFFTGTHERYHKPSDDAEFINAEGTVRVAWLAADVATEVSGRERGLTLVKTAEAPQRRMGGRARLGTIPDYAGDPEGRPGLLLSSVRPGSPAEAGGLQRGDLIIRVGDREIKDINDFMDVLSSAEPGQNATVLVLREGETMELQVTYGARE